MSEPILFLGDAWVKAADEALGALRIEPAAGWSLCYVVNGGPTGTTAHRLVFESERVAVRRGSDDTSVALTMDWELAVAINRGAISAQGAFLDGRIQLSGDPGDLLGHRDELTAADGELSKLRSRTIYGPVSDA